jgi:hypothetical protein
MTTDLLGLLGRDHRDIARGLAELASPATTIGQIRNTLDGVRLGLVAHAEAEDIVIHHALMRFAPEPALVTLIATGQVAHRAQESALSSLVSQRPETQTWRDKARLLLDLVVRHATHEEEVILPALRAAAPGDVWARLAGEFATERLVQLGMLQPSAPIMSYQQLAAL